MEKSTYAKPISCSEVTFSSIFFFEAFPLLLERLNSKLALVSGREFSSILGRFGSGGTSSSSSFAAATISSSSPIVSSAVFV